MNTIRNNLSQHRADAYLLTFVAVLIVVLGCWLSFDLWPLAAQNDNVAAQSVLHFQAARLQFDPEKGIETSIEGWIDLTTWEGKITETSGTHVSVNSLNLDEGIYINYFGDETFGHAVVRHGVGEGSPFLTAIYNPILGPQDAIERGDAAEFGQVEPGEVDGKATTRITIITPDGNTEITDIDPTTGLVVRYEIRDPSSQPFVQETTYQLVEELPRHDIASSVFTVEVDPKANREDYFEGDALKPETIDRYVVYTAPSLGMPDHALRYQSRSFDIESDQTTYIYETENGDLYVESGLLPGEDELDELTRSGSRSAEDIDGTTWWISGQDDPSAETEGIAQMGDTLVTIVAPTMELFQKAVAAIQPFSER